jgi:CubicO group peptidase (beta-lactamase class C family)
VTRCWSDGWSGAVRRERGSTVVEAVAGRVGAGEAPVTADTRIQAGSVSKTVLAITALQLVERDVLSLTAPVGGVLPGLRDDLARSTLHGLLTHTAGFGHWKDLPQLDITDPPPREELLALVLKAPLPHPVGSWSYSNFGFLLAASVLEAATGQRYGDLVRDSVLVPAGMTRTTSGAFQVGEPDGAVGHHDGVVLRTSATPTTIPGTGDLWTTVGDLLRLCRALRDGRLLAPASFAAMTTAHAALTSSGPVGDDRVVASGYGYGVWIGAVQGAPAVICPGDNDGYRSLVLLAQRSDDALAILTNDDGPTLELPLDLALADGPFGERA